MPVNIPKGLGIFKAGCLLSEVQREDSLEGKGFALLPLSVGAQGREMQHTHTPNRSFERTSVREVTDREVTATCGKRHEDKTS